MSTTVQQQQTNAKVESTDSSNSPATYLPNFIMSERKTFICPISDCAKEYRFKSELDRHYAIHTKQRPHVCSFPDCGKTFKRADALSNHLKSHNAENIFTCPVQGCGNQYTTKAALKYHILKHQGLKRFTCRIAGCNRAFITLAQLKQHERAAFYHQKAGNINMNLADDQENKHSEEEHHQLHVKEEGLGSETQSSSHCSESYKLLKVEAEAPKVIPTANTFGVVNQVNQVNMAQNLACLNQVNVQNNVANPVPEENQLNDIVRSLVEENRLLKSRLQGMMDFTSGKLNANINNINTINPAMNALPANMNAMNNMNTMNNMNNMGNMGNMNAFGFLPNGLNLQRLAALQYNFSM